MISVSRTGRATAALVLSAALAACAPPIEEIDRRAEEGRSILEDPRLGDLILTVSDPEDAVEYFRQALASEPGRADYQRGYAVSLSRSKRFAESADAFARLEASGQATPADRVDYANVLTRLRKWDEAEAQMAGVPSSFDTARRNLVDAILADHRKDWTAADAAYERARQRSPEPASILNNWGVSRLSRGEPESAARSFEEALSYDPGMFSAKNNLVIARATQGVYRMPVMALNGEERATLYHNIALVALRRGDEDEAKGLLALAVETHPRYYAAAAEKLRALESIVEN